MLGSLSMNHNFFVSNFLSSYTHISSTDIKTKDLMLSIDLYLAILDEENFA